jgi:hypothetical protein
VCPEIAFCQGDLKNKSNGSEFRRIIQGKKILLNVFTDSLFPEPYLLLAIIPDIAE